VQDALAYGFEPQPRLEGLAATQDGHEPALGQPGHDLACPRAMLAQAGQHTHFDLAPLRFASGLAAVGTKRHHHPVSTYDQGHIGQRLRTRLLRGELSYRDRV
jgi:hypothetical protein